MKSVKAAVKALIQKDSKFLIVKQSLGTVTFWDLPGGKINYGESPYEALHREVKEEVGLEIEIKTILGIWWFLRKDGQGQVVCTTFGCDIMKGKVDLTRNPAKENIVEYEWVSKEAFLSEEYHVSDKSLKEFITTIEIL